VERPTLVQRRKQHEKREPEKSHLNVLLSKGDKGKTDILLGSPKAGQHIIFLDHVHGGLEKLELKS